MSDVLFGDVEADLIDGIRPDLDPIVVGTLVPNPRPDQFVTLQRLGGVGTTVVTEDATIAVEAWGRRDEDAHDLAQLTRYLIHRLVGRTIGGTFLYLVQEFAGPARLVDPISEQPRWTFTLSVRVRGYAL